MAADPRIMELLDALEESVEARTVQTSEATIENARTARRALLRRYAEVCPPLLDEKAAA